MVVSLDGQDNIDVGLYVLHESANFFLRALLLCSWNYFVNFIQT